MTCTEEEVSEKKRFIGKLDAEVKALKQEAKDNAAEYTRNMGTEYKELREARELLTVAHTENEGLRRSRSQAHADPLPGFELPPFDIRRDSSKHEAPCCRYFEDMMAPAMLNTGATPEQMKEIIRKPHSLAPTHTHTHTHPHFTHTFRRA